MLPNIPRNKGDWAIKFAQLIEHITTNIFIEKSCAIFGGEAIPGKFSKKSKLIISLDQ